MDLHRIIGDLVEERNRLQRIIESLEAMDVVTRNPALVGQAAKGRKSTSSKQAPGRMKLYRTQRRDEENSNP